jgi:hypothetical protein
MLQNTLEFLAQPIVARTLMCILAAGALIHAFKPVAQETKEK